MRELYEADFHKPRIFAVERVWANASDVVFCAPSRDGRGRRAAVDLVVCFGWGNFFLPLYLFRTYTACCMYEAASCIVCLSVRSRKTYLFIMKEGLESEATETVFYVLQ